MAWWSDFSTEEEARAAGLAPPQDLYGFASPEEAQAAGYGLPNVIPSGSDQQYITGPDGRSWILAAQTVNGGVQPDNSLAGQPGTMQQNGMTYISPELAQQIGAKYGGANIMDSISKALIIGGGAALSGGLLSGAIGGAPAFGASTSSPAAISAPATGLTPAAISALSTGLTSVSGLRGDGMDFSSLFGGFDPYALTGPLTTGAEGGLAGAPAFGADSLFGSALSPELAYPYAGAPYQPGFNLLDPSTYGGSPPGFFQNLFNNLTGNTGGSYLPGSAGGGDPTQGFLSSLLGTAAGTIPPALAFNWANQQKADLGPLYSSYAAASQPNAYLPQLQQTFNAAGANAPLFVQASQNPLLQSQAAGYGDLTQSLAQRGLGGSSLGATALGNFMDVTNRGIADAGTRAAQTALGLQGSLAGTMGGLSQNQLGLQSSLAQAIPKAQSANLAAMAPILGASMAGVGSGLQSQSAQNLGTNFSNWWNNLFG